MNKVTFNENSVLVNGVEVARMDGRGEVYVTMNDEEVGYHRAIARFKYRAAKGRAKSWCKFIFARMDAKEIFRILTSRDAAVHVSPLPLAEKLGYVCPNVKAMQKKQAEQERLRNTPVKIMTWADLGNVVLGKV